MTTLRIDLAYHGAGFAGWVAQPSQRTVEGELSAALETLLGEPVSLTVAGRTDAGVHAWRQVISFEAGDVPDGDLARSLNGITGEDLVILEAAPAADGFDARRDARSRTYCYRILAAPQPSPFERGLALWWPHQLDSEALDRCASSLLGSHDFTAFTPTQTDHVRFERNILAAEWVRRPIRSTRPEPHPRPSGFARSPLASLAERSAQREQPPVDVTEELSVGVLEFWIEADAFMRGMVRALIGTMLEVGRGRRDPADFERLLTGAPRDQAGDTAQPHGLYLAGVRY